MPLSLALIIKKEVYHNGGFPSQKEQNHAICKKATGILIQSDLERQVFLSFLIPASLLAHEIL